MKVIGCRPHLLGDTVMSLTIAQAMRHVYPDVYFNWVIASKCSQGAPLYLDHPAIDRIIVEDAEGYGPRATEIARTCDHVFDPLPQHPTGNDWPNEEGINIYSETYRMAGLSLNTYRSLPPEVQLPRLTQWFRAERRPKSIALWPSARQGEKENRRVPPYEWWVSLCDRLQQEGYTIYQCGHPKEHEGLHPLGIDVRHTSFMENVSLSLGCDAIIGTDSGSMVVLAAYHSTPTISLLSPHWPNHQHNPLAFGPLGKRHRNLWAPTNRDHSRETTVTTIKEMT